MSHHHHADDPWHHDADRSVRNWRPSAPPMRSHRDYTDAQLARAIASARNRRDAHAEGTDGATTASAIVSTLILEQQRRRTTTTTTQGHPVPGTTRSV